MTILRPGDVGADVRELQRLLRERGERLELTGDFDAATLAAVILIGNVSFPIAVLTHVIKLSPAIK